MGVRCFLTALLLLAAPRVFAHTYATTTVVESAAAGADDVRVGYDSTGIAIADNGTVGLCYHDADNHVLKYARYDGNAWTRETVDNDGGSGDTVGKNCALAFDNNNNPNIVYFNSTDEDLRHAKKSGGVWTIVTVDDDAREDNFGMSRIAIARNRNGAIGIAYYNARTRDLRYATLAGNNWSTETVVSDGDVGRYPSLDYNSANRPAIAYQWYTDATHASLMFIQHNGNAWQAPETIDNVNSTGSFNAFRYDANDKPHIGYRSTDNHNVYYMNYIHKIGAQWSEPDNLSIQMGVTTGSYTQMAFDPLGNLFMIYVDEFQSALFPDARYLRLYSLFFADRGRAYSMSYNDRLTVSAAILRNYEGCAIAVDRNETLYAAWVEEGDLRVAKLTAWSPAATFVAPNANSHAGTNTFQLEWLDFDPDSNADLRFSLWDANFQEIRLGETAKENDANQLEIDIAAIPRGTYTPLIDISEDDFVTFTRIQSATHLTIQNHNPTVPAPSGPADRATVTSATPTVEYAAATDVDVDVLSYQVQIATDDTFNTIAVAGDSNGTQYTAGAALNDNSTYYWRVRARDAQAGTSGWSAARRFTTDVNDAPTAPTAEALSTEDTTPVLTFANATDADGDAVTYFLQICSDDTCALVLQFAQGLAAGSGQNTTYTVPAEINPGTYYWHVRATDPDGANGAWSPLAQLIIAAPSGVAGTPPSGGSGGNAAGAGGKAADPGSGGAGSTGAAARKSGGCSLIP